MELTIKQALQRGITAHRAGKLNEAEKFYRAILHSLPQHPDANHNLGMLALSANKVDVALPLLKNAFSGGQKKDQFLLSYIQALIENKQLDAGKEVIEQSKDAGFSEVALHLSKAEINDNGGELVEAKENFLKVLALKPDHIKAYNGMGIVLQKMGKMENSEQSHRRSLILGSKVHKSHFDLANLLKECGRLEEAVVSYKKAIACTTGFVAAHKNLALTYRELGRIEQAMESERYVKFLNTSNIGAEQHDNTSDKSTLQRPGTIEHPLFYRPGMGTENVGGFLRAMAQMLRPKNILEIGAGYTTPFLLEAIINNERVYDDGNLNPEYFNGYIYDPKLVIIDDMSLGELRKKPGMDAIISSEYTDFIEGNFEGKSNILRQKYGNFDFVWFDCGGAAEYKAFIDEYWDICSGYIFFHFTYSYGIPNNLHDIILKNITGSPAIFDIIEPHKSRQGSITMVKKH